MFRIVKIAFIVGSAMTNETEEFETLKNISGNIKLSSKHVLPVLEQIKKGQPSRAEVAEYIVENVFPEKERKSVFRGMVVPTTTKLHLARKNRQKKTFFLSPNGESCLYEGKNRKQLGRCIRDFVTLEWGLFREAVTYLEENGSEIRERDERVFQNSRRFKNQYLDEFDIDTLPKSKIKSNPILVLYEDNSEYISNPNMRREIINSCFRGQQLYQIENARWRIIKELFDRGVSVSTWFADEIMWSEMNSTERIIDLWEASTVSNTKLKRGTTTFEGLVLRRS